MYIPDKATGPITTFETCRPAMAANLCGVSKIFLSSFASTEAAHADDPQKSTVPNGFCSTEGKGMRCGVKVARVSKILRGKDAQAIAGSHVSMVVGVLRGGLSVCLNHARYIYILTAHCALFPICECIHVHVLLYRTQWHMLLRGHVVLRVAKSSVASMYKKYLLFSNSLSAHTTFCERAQPTHTRHSRAAARHARGRLCVRVWSEGVSVPKKKAELQWKEMREESVHKNEIARRACVQRDNGMVRLTVDLDFFFFLLPSPPFFRFTAAPPPSLMTYR